jgi:hypothetical protein
MNIFVCLCLVSALKLLHIFRLNSTWKTFTSIRVHVSCWTIRLQPSSSVTKLTLLKQYMSNVNVEYSGTEKLLRKFKRPFGFIINGLFTCARISRVLLKFNTLPCDAVEIWIFIVLSNAFRVLLKCRLWTWFCLTLQLHFRHFENGKCTTVYYSTPVMDSRSLDSQLSEVTSY